VTAIANVNTTGAGAGGVGIGAGTGEASALTITAAFKLVTPLALAVMFAVPSPIALATALALPLVLTDATFKLSLCHVTVDTGNCFPLASKPCAVYVCVPPTARLTLLGLIEIECSTGTTTAGTPPAATFPAG